MEATNISVDEELKNYLAQFSESRKKSVLAFVKLLADEEEVVGKPQTLEEYNKEIEEAEERIEAGDFYTHEEVKAMMNNWFK